MGGEMTQNPSTDDASKCMKCGFCMYNCPIYKVDHNESHVARGRNVLIKQANEKTIPSDAEYAERLSFCLLCGRCAAVCPAKVQSPDINVAARTNLVNQKGLSLPKRAVYQGILKNRQLMANLLGIARLVPGVSTKDGKPLRHMADFTSVFTKGLALPRLSKPFLSARLPAVTKPPEGVKVKRQVAIFPGCAFEFFFAETGEGIAQNLAKAGYEVVYIKDLTCCGLAVRSAGDIKTAQEMAKHNIAKLEKFEKIITGCATCGSALKDYGKWFAADDPMQKRAQAFSAKVSDFSEFLAKEGIKSKSAEPVIVTFHDPCHLKWHQGISSQPRELLRSIEGVKFVEMEGADDCCGMGGAFTLAHRDISLAIQDKKMQSIKNTGAQIVVTACPGCLIQLRDGVKRAGLPVEVMHISELMRGKKSDG
jgi:glycolate oxidase iron-sulfur subunit